MLSTALRSVLFAGLVGSVGINSARADVIVDFSPDTLGVLGDVHFANGITFFPQQTSGDVFQTTQDYQITAGSIFSPDDAGVDGDIATLVIYELVGGLPGAIVFMEQGMISVDTVDTSIDPALTRKTITLDTPFLLPAGDYVFSLYGQLEIFQTLANYDDDTVFWGDGSNPDLNNGAFSGLGDALFQLHGDSEIGSTYCSPAVPNSSGLAAVLSASGSTAASSNNVSLTATQLPTFQFGYFLNSQTQGLPMMPPNSQGNLCLAGGIGRYNDSVLNSGAMGTFGLALDLTQTPTAGGTSAIVAGQTWNFQAWFRDNNPGQTSNFTDALSITFD